MLSSDFTPEASAAFSQRVHRLTDTLARFVRSCVLQEASIENLTALDLEMPNLAALLDRILTSPSSDTAQRLIGPYLNLCPYLHMRDLWQRKREWGLALLAFGDSFEKDNLANLLNNVGVTYRNQGEDENAIDYYLRSIEARGTTDEDLFLARTYSNLGVCYWDIEDFDRALHYMNLALEMERRLGDRENEAQSLINIAGVHYHRFEMDEGLALAQGAVAIVREIGNRYLLGQFTDRLAGHMVATFHFDEAVPIYEEALQLLTETRDAVGLARCKFNYALLQRLLSNHERALLLAGEALEVMERYGLSEADHIREWLAKMAETLNPGDPPTDPPEAR